MGSEDMRQHLNKIELIGKDPVDGDIDIYLFEVRSVTARLRNDIARRFRERPEKALLVLTQDYEELESSCWSALFPEARAGVLPSSRPSVLSRSRSIACTPTQSRYAC
jgi:hypothetical protein